MAGKVCAAVNCRNYEGKCSKSFFRFPQDIQRCTVWVKNTQREDLHGKSADYLHKNCRLCANHFEDSQFYNTKDRNRLLPYAVPTLFGVPNLPQGLQSGQQLLKRSAFCSSPPQKKQRLSDVDMVRYCSAFNCYRKDMPETREEGFTFHSFPKDGALRQQWERSVRGEGWNASDNSRLCSSHFDEKWFDRTGQTVRLREGAIPTACDIPAQLEPRDVKPDSIHMSCSAAEAQGNDQGAIKGVIDEMSEDRAASPSIAFEMTCESVDDEYVSGQRQEVNTCTSLPFIASVMSLSTNSGNNQHISSPLFPVTDFPSATKRTLSPPMSQSLLKRMRTTTNRDCYVLLERLPQWQLEAVPQGRFVPALNSDRGDNTAAAVTLQPDVHAVKSELDDPSTIDYESAPVAHLAAQGHSTIVNPSLNTATMIDSPHPSVAVTGRKTTDTSSRATRACVKSDGVQQDISVILLKSTRPPNTTAAHASNLVVSMLQRQDVRLLPVSSSDSVSTERQNDNASYTGSPAAADNAAELRKMRNMLQISNRTKAALETKLKAERAKVTYLLAMVGSLKNTIKQLSSNHANAECGDLAMECHN